MYVGVTGYMYKWKYLKSMSIFISPVSHFLINTDTFQTGRLTFLQQAQK